MRTCPYFFSESKHPFGVVVFNRQVYERYHWNECVESMVFDFDWIFPVLLLHYLLFNFVRPRHRATTFRRLLFLFVMCHPFSCHSNKSPRLLLLLLLLLLRFFADYQISEHRLLL